MKKREVGQALMWVLIVLAVGALVAVPALGLTGTSLKSSQIVNRQMKGLYAADAAQEFILWKLLYDNLGSEFTDDGQSAHYDLDVCGVPVGVTIIMRATEGEGGTTLATDDVIQPTKTVEPTEVPDKRWETYTYTINLDHLSSDTSVKLDAICDVPPGNISEYITGSSQVRIDGGAWQNVPDPLWDNAKGYLVWPADYDFDTGTGAFSSDPLDVDHYFCGMRDFEVRQVNEIRLQLRDMLNNDEVHCNWVVLKMEDGHNTLSGPQAPITVGSPADPGECHDSSVLGVIKNSVPDIIQPGVETDIEYTISITNQYTQTRHIEEITDFLPPDFLYLGPTSGITDEDPIVTLETINGLERYQLRWTTSEFPNDNAVSIASDETLTLTFWGKATKDVSGTYYNEVVIMLTETGLSSAFDAIGVLPSDYGTNYSWNTGAVIVPAYDSSSESEGVTINANMSLILGGITITSWQVD